ncbi:MAG: hypothetical protein KC731_18170 [Myxococcales bacterium]|nr:hypothetical protein [Myxococcales bacterium]
MTQAKLDKEALKQALVGLLSAERDTVREAQRATSEGVTHEDNRQESDKDMRSTEASYLARGQAARAQALEEDVNKVRAMALRKFREDSPIGISAVVELVVDGAQERLVWLAPAGGGSELEQAGQLIHVVTPPSPLGRLLLGAHVGDLFDLETPGKSEEIEIRAVQ